MRPIIAATAGSLVLLFMPAGSVLQAQTPERVDLDAIHQIKIEATQNSKVMEHLFYLTDVSGPRVTNSPGFFAAADWVVKQLREWGLDAHQEKWGPYGRGWTYTYFSAHLIEPQYAPMIGFPLAFTPSTNGAVTAEAMLVNLANDADLERTKGKLKGKVVLLGAGRDMQMITTAPGRRYTDSDLATIALAPEAAPQIGPRPPGSDALAANGGGNGGRGGRGGANAQPNQQQQRQFQNRLNQFLHDEAPAVVVRMGTGRSEGGTVFGQAGGSRDPKEAVPAPMAILTPEHYNRVARLLDHKIPVKMEFNIQAKFFDDTTDSINVIGEIPGGSKKDELVMIGAHLDSWQGGTGATDNAAGSAVMIEALRILKTLNLPLNRTVRMALWSGEEEGLLGSRAYVTEHFAAREDMKLKPEHAKLSAYFNVDNGSGKIRGVYLQGNDMMRPVFDAWFKPFQDMGAGTISVRNTGGTDHQSFDAVGLPGFQFIQEPLEYDSRTHHSNMDVYDRVQKADMEQMAAIVASFVYQAANREQMLPRKPLPKPQPAQPQNGGAGRGN
ncbi:MAG TPA: M20/M25/M40 family metallo-hydrolase [Bryobacteraceae bacterium]|nr:M20/M25/M40 family metallo-hydrolase [Bryobacteraceae bacterium]